MRIEKGHYYWSLVDRAMNFQVRDHGSKTLQRFTGIRVECLSDSSEIQRWAPRLLAGPTLEDTESIQFAIQHCE
ncbi:hypothetical protein CEXT_487921, partial [Caerostris extrusa]